MNALSTKSDKLWQTPKFTEFACDGMKKWYYSKMGHNQLNVFVKKYAKILKWRLNTNHRLRVTAI